MALTQANPNPSSVNDNDPHHHSAKIAVMLDAVIQHARQDGRKVDDPKARALFETTAEVLTGLKKAYNDFDQHAEAWR